MDEAARLWRESNHYTLKPREEEQQQALEEPSFQSAGLVFVGVFTKNKRTVLPGSTYCSPSWCTTIFSEVES